MLFLGVVGDFVGGAADGAVVGTEPVYGVSADVAGEERVLQRAEPLGDVVLAVELVLGEHLLKDVLGQDVLQQHLAHVLGPHLLANGLVAEVEEVGGGGPVGRVALLGRVDGGAQVFEDGGEVGLELPLRLAELPDFR